MLISFGVVFFILAKFAFPMITKSVEERKTYVETSLNDAKQAKETLSRVEDDTKALIAEANKEQGRVLNEAAAQRDKIMEKVLKEKLSDKDTQMALIDKMLEEVVKDGSLQQSRLS